MLEKSIPILFRADMSHALGTGHVMRCIAFVSGLPIKINPILIFRDYSGSETVFPILQKKGWHLFKLINTLSEQDELIAIKKLVSETKSTILITDLVSMPVLNEPNKLAAYHQNLRKIKGLRIISIEDSRLSVFTSHVAVIGNSIYPLLKTHEDNQHCTILAGTKYFICHPSVAAQAKKTRMIRRIANRVLIFIGGSDNAGVTKHVLAAIQRNNSAKHLKIKVIVGPTMEACLRKQIVELVAQLGNVELIEFSDSIGELLYWADIAVVGEGSIKFEAAIVGTPALLISQFDHDSKPIRDFLSIGCAIHFPFSKYLTKKIIFKKIISLLENYTTRQQMSAVAQQFFDGKAVERIYNEVIKNGINEMD